MNPERIPERIPGRGDFVLLAELVPDVMLEMRYYSTFNFIGSRVEGYQEPVAILTRAAAEALGAVSGRVKAMGLRLKVFDAFRPQRAVDHFLRWSRDLGDVRMKRYFYPDLTKDRLFPLGYLAEDSGHSRGSTVDLTLFHMERGRDMDMGGGFDLFGERSHTRHTATLTEEQIKNRRLLQDLMAQGGFRGANTEWWHFTLKDEPYPDTYFDFPVAASSVTG